MVTFQALNVNGEEGRFSGERSRGYSSAVLKTLSEDMHHSHLHLHTSCPVLTFCLISHVGLYGCGTHCLNCRGFPAVLKVHVKKGFNDRGESETVMHKNSNVTVLVWQV